GADGGDLEERRKKRTAAGFFEKCLSQHESDTRAAEIIAWIRTPGLIWIENSVGAGGTFGTGQMVVGDDKVEAKAAGGFGGGKGADAGIDADDELDSGCGSLLD